MNYEINGTKFVVNIIRKNNKNTYIRVNENLEIIVTTSRFTTKSYVKKLLDNNINSIEKMINKRQQQLEKRNNFFFLGKSYDIIEVPTIDKLEIVGNYIYYSSKKYLDKWLKETILLIFKERLEYNFKLFEEIKTCPTLKIRNMKTRWGVYNRLKHNITLNSRLIEYTYKEIDYVIIHELSHVIHFNHSKDFWNLVEKYCPDYKKIRRNLKE